MLPRWSDVLQTFGPAWFTVCMGTGAMQQCLTNFAYPQSGTPRWMSTLGYCLWILDIVVFVIFVLIISCQWVLRPGSLKKTITTFPSCSYLGAIPIALDTIIGGLTTYYGTTDNGKWTAFAFYWVNVVLTVAISFGLLLFEMTRQVKHSTEDIAGVWLMTAVPLVIVANTGSGMSHAFSPRVNMLLIIMSFLLWSVGMVLVHFILLCYFWRLIARHLPPVQFIPSGFLPLAPLSQGAAAVLNSCIALSSYLHQTLFTPTMSAPPPLPQSTIWAVGETLHYLGIMVALSLLAHASFWAVQSTVAMITKPPKQFVIGMWSMTFPVMSYTVAWASLGKDLRNDGMKGFAAALTVLSGILWLSCASLTVWHGLVTGRLLTPVEEKPTSLGHEEAQRVDSMQMDKDHDLEARRDEDFYGLANDSGR